MNKFRRIICAILLLLLLLIVSCCIYGFFIEPNRLVLHQETIQIDNWPKELTGLRIALIGDIHTGGPFINEQKLREIVIPSTTGAQIPLGQVANVQVVQGPMTVKTEDAFPVTTVTVDVAGRDVGSYVREAQRVVATRLTLPPGYRLTWSGQFESMQRVRAKLRLVVPVTLGIIFVLLYLNFRGGAESLIVMLTVPFALVGGVWSIWALGYNTSVAVWVAPS